MDSRLIGGVLLIVGTSIGAGMLGLPIATAQLGFVGSVILLLGCWLVMTAGALLTLEANLWLPQNSNIISMAKATLGGWGELFSWVIYLLLLYSLLCAYIAGGSDLLHNLLLAEQLETPRWASSILFTLVLGLVVYLGIRSVDYVNRSLMFIKLGAYVLVVILLFPFISPEKLAAGEIKYMTSATALTVTITSFGFSAVVPSLRVYLLGDVQKLRKAILIGSLIPLVCYLAWDMVIMGIIPLAGGHGLISILHSKNSTSDLVNVLNSQVPYQMTVLFTKLFTSICVVTSFLAITLCLSDFLADGFQIEKKGRGHFIIYGATLLPPLIMVLFFPHIFITALQYAGVDCVVLSILLPALMVWRGRYHRAIAREYQMVGGKILLVVLIAVALFIMAKGILG